MVGTEDGSEGREEESRSGRRGMSVREEHVPLARILPAKLLTGNPEYATGPRGAVLDAIYELRLHNCSRTPMANARPS